LISINIYQRLGLARRVYVVVDWWVL